MASPGLEFNKTSLVALSFCMAVVAQNPYVYKPLAVDTKVRLLLLYPGSNDEPLFGTLETWDMNHKPREYIALSYHWGPLDLNRQIHVDGLKLDITTNLHAALLKIRATNAGSTSAIWADAICVNQQDAEERSQQVGLMQRIYSECHECYIYLGEEADDSNEIPGMVFKLTMAYTGLRHMALPGTASVRIEEADYGRHSVPDASYVGWRALRRFLERPWFRRVWVIQEFVLSPRATMFCGSWKMPGHVIGGLALMNVQTSLPSFFGREPTGETTEGRNNRAKSIEMLMWHNSLKNAVRGNVDEEFTPEKFGGVNKRLALDLKNLELVHLLEICKTCEATDLRDRFFSTLSLAVDIADMGLKADYTLSIDEVRSEWISKIIKHGKGLKMLQFVAPRKPSGDGLPSWSPNWVSYEYAKGDWQFFLVNSDPVLSSEALSAGYNVTIGSEPNELLLRGCSIDKVLTCATKTLGDRDVTSDLVCQTEIDALTDATKSYPTGESVYEAKWRAMAAYQTLPADSQDYPAYRESLRLKNSGFWDSLSTKTREEVLQAAAQFNTIRDRTTHARFCITSKGYFGMVAEDVAIGDDILVVPGFPQAYIVREDSASKTHRWMGAAYIHGIFDGEKDILTSEHQVTIVIR